MNVKPVSDSHIELASGMTHAVAHSPEAATALLASAGYTPDQIRESYTPRPNQATAAVLLAPPKVEEPKPDMSLVGASSAAKKRAKK